MGLRLSRLILAGAGVCAASAGAISAELHWSGELGGGHSDNIARVRDNPQDENIGEAGLQLALTEKTRLLAADLAMDVAYLDYFKHRYKSEFIGSVKGDAELDVIPERFRWVTTDSFGQTRRDPFAADTPDNRENINYFTTGPELAFRIAERSRALASARYSRVDYETSPFDSQRYLGSLGLGHELSASSSLSIEASSERVDFTNNPAAADYDRRQVVGKYALMNSRTTLALGAGYNRVTQQNANFGGSLFSIDLTHQISSRSQWWLGAGQELTDSGASYGAGATTSAVSLDAQSLSLTAEPFKSRHAGARWDATGRRTRLGASVGYYQERYLRQSQFDRNRTLGDLHFYRDLAARVGLRVTGQFVSDDYQYIVGDSREQTVEVALALRAGRKTFVDASVQRYHRTSDIDVGNVDENRFWLRLRIGEQFVPRIGAFAQLRRPTLEVKTQNPVTDP
jgi:hypothetical protein